MAVKVLTTTLQKFTNNQPMLECGGNNVAELESLEQSCPGDKSRLCDEQGQPRRFLNLYVNSEDIRLEGTDTPPAGDVSIVPAVAGG